MTVSTMKQLAIVLLAAAIPGWANGQAKPETKPQLKIELKPIEIKGIKFQFDKEISLDGLFKGTGAEGDAAMKAKEIEAKIAQLTKELAALKAARAAKEPSKPIKAPMVVEGKVRIVTVDGPTGRIIETREVEAKAPPAAKHAEAQLAEARKRLEKLVGELNGKSLMLGVGAKAEANSGVINLSRATYALPKEKAESLAAFLKENIKPSVLEFKIENHGLTVTTTPEVLAAIGGIAKLMTNSQPVIRMEMRRLEKKE
jgi:hypothetical protein